MSTGLVEAIIQYRPYTYGAGFKVNHGASERHIFNTADWDESFTVIPTGASGVPASEFYLSQTKTYIEGKFYKDAFTEGAVKAAAKYTLILKPADVIRQSLHLFP